MCRCRREHGSAQLSRLFRAPWTRAKNRAGRRLWSCSTMNWFARHPNFDPMAALLAVLRGPFNIDAASPASSAPEARGDHMVQR